MRFLCLHHTVFPCARWNLKGSSDPKHVSCSWHEIIILTTHCWAAWQCSTQDMHRYWVFCVSGQDRRIRVLLMTVFRRLGRFGEGQYSVKMVFLKRGDLCCLCISQNSSEKQDWWVCVGVGVCVCVYVEMLVDYRNWLMWLQRPKVLLSALNLLENQQSWWVVSTSLIPKAHEPGAL